jgi:hypothetical protein
MTQLVQVSRLLNEQLSLTRGERELQGQLLALNNAKHALDSLGLEWPAEFRFQARL